MEQESKRQETPLDELRAQLAKERQHRHDREELMRAFNSVLEPLFQCSWKNNKESFLPCGEGESYDDWIGRFDMALVGQQFVRRWPPLAKAILQSAAIIGYEPEEIIARPHCPPPERDRRCAYIAKHFARIFRDHENGDLVESIAAEVAQVYAEEKRSVIEWYHELFEHMEARLRIAGEHALREVEAGQERSSGRTPIDDQARRDESHIRERLPSGSADRVVQVYRKVRACAGERVPRTDLKGLGIPPTTVDRDYQRRGAGTESRGPLKVFPKSYLLAYMVERWSPRAPE